MTATVHTIGAARDIGRGAVDLAARRAATVVNTRARRAVGQLPGLATRDADTIRAGLSTDPAAHRIDALETLAAYWAEVEHAAGLDTVAEDTADHVEYVLDGLTPGVDENSRGEWWDCMTENAAELLHLRRHALAKTTPKYSTPLGGAPIVGQQAQRAMDVDVATRRETMRHAAVLLAGAADDLPGGAA